MDIPFNILVLYLSIAILIFLVGLLMGIRRIAGAPFIMIFPAIMIFGLLALIVNINVDYVQDVTYTLGYPMYITSGSATTAFSSTLTGISEHAAVFASQLNGTKISCVAFVLSKTGAPIGTATIGILDNDNMIVKTIGTVDVSTLNTSTRRIDFCLPNHDYWLLANIDRVGIKYTGSSGGNFISVGTDTANPFDGTNTVFATYTSGAWSDIAGTDARLIIISDNSNVYGKAVPYKLTDEDTYAFLLILAFFFMLIGIIYQIRSWDR